LALCRCGLVGSLYLRLFAVATHLQDKVTPQKRRTTIRSLCVFCGSSTGKRDDYTQASHALADALVEADIELVYGGAHVGIMGSLANRVLAGGGKVIGVIPESLVDFEVAHEGLTELMVVADMHARKAAMAERSDGFIALPGGLGTLEELFEVLTWAQLGFHKKPCGLLNISGFYDGLLTFLDHACGEDFMKPQHRNLVMADTDPHSLLERFANHEPTAPVAPKLDIKP